MQPDRIIPDASQTYEAWQRATHADLAELEPARAWAELILLRQHLARLVWQRSRRLRVVTTTPSGDIVDERQWTIDRIDRLERLLARRGRAA